MKKILLIGILLLFGVNSIIHASEKAFFTLKQETYFAEHPHVYAYFSQLYPNQSTPTQIAKKYGLSDAVNRKYLQALVDIRIIEINWEDLSVPPHFLVKGVSTFSHDGPLSKKVTKSMLKQYYEKLDRTNFQDPKNQTYTSMPGFWLAKSEYNEYRQELVALQDKYINISLKNRSTNSPNTFIVSTLNSLIPEWEPEVFTEIKNDF